MFVTPAIPAPVHPAVTAAHSRAQTKTEAEVNVLRAVERSWLPARIPDLVDARTRLPADNTDATCRGRGRRARGNRYTRFVCVVRPRIHARRQGLYVSYRALPVPGGRFRIHWLAYRRH